MDAVIVWTDTEGKEYRRNLMKYISLRKNMQGHNSSARSRSEFLFTLASILRNVPEVDKIIVVSAYVPEQVDGFISRNFKDNQTELIFVSFQELFRGFEGFLPSFSDTAATTLLYRLPCLGSSFILFKLGCIPFERMDPDSLVEDGKTVYYGRMEKVPRLKKTVFGKSRRFRLSNYPVMINKKDIEECLSSHSGLLADNLRQKFDWTDNWNAVENHGEGQQDIVALLACRPGAIIKLENDKQHGPISVRLSPCDDISFSRAMETAGNARFLDFEPFSSFSGGQRDAIRDYLCMKLRINI